jgi:hypothetical protein
MNTDDEIKDDDVGYPNKHAASSNDGNVVAV